MTLRILSVSDLNTENIVLVCFLTKNQKYIFVDSFEALFRIRFDL